MKRITLNNGIAIELTKEELQGIDINKLDLSYKGLYQINTKSDFLNYLQTKKNEIQSFKIAEPLLNKINVTIKEKTTDRFAHFDAIATSATTDAKGNIINEDIVYVELKYRTGTTNDQYNSVIVDGNKMNQLIILRRNTGKKVLFISVYSDNSIRILDVDDYNEYKEKKEKTFRKNDWSKQNETKKNKLVFYPNEITKLIK